MSLLVMACEHSKKGHSTHAQHRFDDAEAWAAHFEDPDRDAWQKPDEVISKLALGDGALVGDLGSATGYFSVRLARALPNGIVYGVDIESSMVDYLRGRAINLGLGNVRSILDSPDDAKLPEPVDLVLIVNTYHHIQNRADYFRRLLPSLKPGGRIAIIDFRIESTLGPPEEIKLAPQTVVDEFKGVGFIVKETFDFLPEQYFLIFSREG